VAVFFRRIALPGIPGRTGDTPSATASGYSTTFEAIQKIIEKKAFRDNF